MSGVGGQRFLWSKSKNTNFGYGRSWTSLSGQKNKFGAQQGWSHARLPMRHFRSRYFRNGGAQEGHMKKLMWGDFAEKLPVSIFYQPGSISGSSPNEQGLITKPIAPEFAGSYQAQPWVAPDVFPDNHPLTRMPAPVRNVVAQAERKKNFWSSEEWYTMAEGDVLTPFEVLECEVRRVGMWMKGGRHWRIMVTVLVANGDGVAGLGIGEDTTYDKARQSGITNAFGNLVAIDNTDKTVTHPLFYNFNNTKAQILPSKSRSGNSVLADLMQGFGLNGKVQVKKGVHKKYKKLMTMMAALRTMRGSKVIAQQRGVNVATTRSPIFTYLENIRRRRGMFEMAPEGQSGFLPPNRVIDNRMPDHLKARYFQGTADESFGRIASSDTFRQDAGTERYGKYNQSYLNLEGNKGDHLSALHVPGYRAPTNNRGGRDETPAYSPAWSKGVQSRAREEWLAA